MGEEKHREYIRFPLPLAMRILDPTALSWQLRTSCVEALRAFSGIVAFPCLEGARGLSVAFRPVPPVWHPLTQPLFLPDSVIFMSPLTARLYRSCACRPPQQALCSLKVRILFVASVFLGTSRPLAQRMCQ